MPAVAPIYIPPTERAAKAIDDLADKEREERAAQITRYWAYYFGNHDKPLRVAANKRDDNLIVNMAGQAIDKLVAFFVPDEPEIVLPDGVRQIVQPDGTKVTARDPMQEALDLFWADAPLRPFLIDVALSGFNSGHNFVKLLPPQVEGDTTPDTALLDPKTTQVFWDEGNIHRVLWYRIQWGKAEHLRRQDIVPVWLLREVGDGEARQYDPASEWFIYEYEQRRNANGGAWTLVGEDPYPWPFAPVIDWKNTPLPHQFYGQSDLKHIGINDAVNFIASNTARIIRHHAHPKTAVMGANLGTIKETSIEGILELPEGAQLTNLEMKGDLSSSMAMMDKMRAAFFAQMRVVDWATQKDKVGQLTNFGLRVLFDDMLDMVKQRQQVYGRALAEISRRALVMMGYPDAPLPDVTWPDPLPVDRLEEVKAAVEEQKLGTSPQTLMEAVGRDPDEESARNAQRQQSSGDAFAAMITALNRGGGGVG